VGGGLLRGGRFHIASSTDPTEDPRPTLDVSQRGEGTAPAVLVHFREIVGGGSVFGPYRGYLYYWRTHDTGVITAVVGLLWPWLGAERREQIRATLRAVPALWCAETLGEIWDAHQAMSTTAEEARAWAGGFFEGDGSIGAYAARARPTRRPTLSASISQASTSGVPTCLGRFHDVVRIGHIRGPIAPRGWSRLPQYRWEANEPESRVRALRLDAMACRAEARAGRASDRGGDTR